MAAIRINTGRIRLEVERDGEKAGVIAFNPTDVGFVERYYQLYSTCSERMEQYQQTASELAENDYDGQFRLMHRIVEEMEAEIDKVFGTGTSAAAFGEEQNLDMFLSFFDAVLPYIQKARESSVSRYLSDGQGTLT